MDQTDFDDLAEKIANEARNIIRDSINNSSDINHMTIQDFKIKYDKKYDWMAVALKSIIEAGRGFKLYENITANDSFNTDFYVTASKVSNNANDLSMGLSIVGKNDGVTNNLKRCFLGGEFQKDNGETVVVNKSDFDEKSVQEAANKLRDYFVKKLYDKYKEEK